MNILSQIKNNVDDYLKDKPYEHLLRYDAGTEIQKVTITINKEDDQVVIRISKRPRIT
jgi:hypothetical protein